MKSIKEVHWWRKKFQNVLWSELLTKLIYCINAMSNLMQHNKKIFVSDEWLGDFDQNIYK